MTLGIGADPDVLPCGRNGERADAPQRFGVTQWRAISIAIAEALAAANSADAGLCVGNVTQPRFFGRLDGVDGGCMHGFRAQPECAFIGVLTASSRKRERPQTSCRKTTS